MNLKELLQEKKRLDHMMNVLNKEMSDLQDQRSQVESEVFKKMQAEGIDKSGIDGLTVNVKSDLSARITDWDKLYSYINSNNCYNLLHRRINTTAFKELVNSGTIPDGVEVEAYEKLSFRKS